MYIFILTLKVEKMRKNCKCALVIITLQMSDKDQVNFLILVLSLSYTEQSFKKQNSSWKKNMVHVIKMDGKFTKHRLSYIREA